MKMHDANELIQTLVGLSVIVGVILVVLQLRQNEVLTFGEVRSEQYDAWQYIDALPLSSTFAEVMVRALDAPDELTLEDAIELDGRMFAILDQFDRIYDLSELGIFDGDPDGMVTPNVEYYFGNRFAMSWWFERKSQFNPRLVAAVDSMIGKVSPDANLEYYRRILDRSRTDELDPDEISR